MRLSEPTGISRKSNTEQKRHARQKNNSLRQKDENPNLKVWESINSKTKEKSFCIRYESQQEGIDYIIIFAKKGGKNGKDVFYTLKTAFPISLKSFKKRFNREYDKYKEKMAK